MAEIRETTELNKAHGSLNETEGMDYDFEAELDRKCEEYMSEGRSLEDIQRDKEELMQIREKLVRHKELREADTTETGDGDADSEKVLALRRHI